MANRPREPLYSRCSIPPWLTATRSALGKGQTASTVPATWWHHRWLNTRVVIESPSSCKRLRCSRRSSGSILQLLDLGQAVRRQGQAVVERVVLRLVGQHLH